MTTVSVGTATETNTALPILYVRQAESGETALPILYVRQASETDLALSISAQRLVSVGLASETDVALSISAQRAVSVGLASEADTALPFSYIKQAVETDIALSITPTNSIFFPTQLPAVLVAGYIFNELQATKTGEYNEGLIDFELFSEDVPTIFNVSWLLSQNQFRIFEGWYKWKISKGAKPFTIKLSVGKGYETHTCYLLNGYKPELAGKMIRVSAELMTVGKIYDSEVDFEALLI